MERLGSLLQQIPIPAYQNFIQSTGIYAFTQVLVNVTTNMLALYAAFAISYVFVKNEGYDGFTGGILSLIAFMIVTPMETVGEGWAAVTNLPLSWLGAKGLFTAMFVALLTGYIYSFLMRKNILSKCQIVYHHLFLNHSLELFQGLLLHWFLESFQS